MNDVIAPKQSSLRPGLIEATILLTPKKKEESFYHFQIGAVPLQKYLLYFHHDKYSLAWFPPQSTLLHKMVCYFNVLSSSIDYMIFGYHESWLINATYR